MRPIAALIPFVLACVAGACESTDYRIDPVLYSDTVEIAVPSDENAALPTALDVSVFSDEVRGGIFPERASAAGQWDFALRRRDGGLALVPGRALGLSFGGAVTRALLNESYGTLIEAPGRTSFVTDSAVVLELGRVYSARSRVVISLVGSACEQYAKLQPLELDPVLGRARLQITTNANCSDPRLALEDD